LEALHRYGNDHNVLSAVLKVYEPVKGTEHAQAMLREPKGRLSDLLDENGGLLDDDSSEGLGPLLTDHAGSRARPTHRTTLRRSRSMTHTRWSSSQIRSCGQRLRRLRATPTRSRPPTYPGVPTRSSTSTTAIRMSRTWSMTTAETSRSGRGSRGLPIRMCAFTSRSRT